MKQILFATMLTGLMTFTIARADDQCPGITELSAKGQVGQALHDIRAIEDTLLDKYYEVLRTVIPAKVGVFTAEPRPAVPASPGIARERRMLRQHMANNVTYKAVGLPVIHATFSTPMDNSWAASQCLHPSNDEQVPLGEYTIRVMKTREMYGSATLCLKGGSVQISSESASREQLLQFFKDLSVSDLQAFAQLVAPLAEDERSPRPNTETSWSSKNARLVPYFREGLPIGVRIFAIRAGSGEETRGFKNGDIIKSANGLSLGDSANVEKFLSLINEPAKLEALVERSNQDVQVNWQPPGAVK